MGGRRKRRVGADDLLMEVIWSVEWILNSYIWALLLGFSVLMIRVLNRYAFRASVETVVHEKHYRPFLLMSVQGASILLLFGIAYALYVWYADGTFTDYASLCITGALLLLGFVPSWLRLKNGVEHAMDQEAHELRHKLLLRGRSRASSFGGDGPVDLTELTARVHETWAMNRIAYLESLKDGLGKAEGKAIVLRLVASAGAGAWEFFRPLFLGS